jgi:DNA-binding MarR family transcriptional regulator
MPKTKSRKKPNINISELLRKHKAGQSIGSTNRARLVARGLIARKSGPYKGRKKDLGNRGKS